MKILVVEDEPKLMEVIRQSLEKEEYLVISATNQEEAIDRIGAYDYDCILLDIMLPDGSGLDILQELKAMGKQESVIIISAKDSLDDKLIGLESGADDYLSKPFHMAELTARIKSVLRRKSFDGKATLKLGNLELDPDNRALSISGAQITLNRKEFDILTYLMLNKDRLVSRSSLAEHVWGDYIDQADDFDFIYSQIKNLRKKLKDANASVIIDAVYGMGYKLTSL